MFFKKKKQRKTPNNQEQQGDAFKIFTVQDYEKIAQYAVDYAKVFDKNFDYSDDSVDEMQEILESVRRQARRMKLAEDYLWDLSVAFGIYFGQTILKNHLAEKGYAWKQGSNGIPVVENDKKTNLSPITKIYKHLTQEEEEDIQGFYETSILLDEIAQMLLKK